MTPRSVADPQEREAMREWWLICWGQFLLSDCAYIVFSIASGEEEEAHLAQPVQAFRELQPDR